MTLRSSHKIWIAYIAILSFAFSANSAFADYVAFQNQHPQNKITGFSEDGQIFGVSNGDRLDVLYTATSTITLFDRIDVYLCRYGGSTGGRIDVEFRTTASSSSIIASSTIAVNSGNIWDGDGCYTHSGATSTTFVLNNNIQWVADVPIWISFYPRGTTGTYYFGYYNTASLPSINFQAWHNNFQLYTDAPYSKTFGLQIKGYGLGSVSSNQNQGPYNASTTASVCTSFDIGCYISTSLSFLFYPTYTIALFSETPTIASTTPFNYLYEVGDIWDTIFAGGATGTQSLTLSFSPMGMTTTTITAGSLEATTQNHGFFSTIRNWIEVFLYLGFAFGLFRIALGLIGWTHIYDGAGGGIKNNARRAENITKGVYNRFKL